MTRKAKVWAGALAVVIVGGVVAVELAGQKIVKHFEPLIRAQAIQYLRERFDGDVQVADLRVAIPALSPIGALWTGGRGTLAKVEGREVILRHKGRTDIPPLFVLKNFRFEMDLGALMDNPRTISRVTLTGMEITIPPKGERAKFGEGQGSTPVTPDDDHHPKASVLVAEVFVRDTTLVILPRDKSKLPLRFDIHDVKLQAAGKDVAMRYDAWLRNPKPPGEIHSKGSFGPWAAEEPGDTPLTGAYTFDDADLGIFQGISGILHSVGNFQGTLSAINAKGTATVPDFRLKRADNPMPLYAQFEVGVDGTNGNTTLKPVHATLGRTTFTTSGAVIKHTGDERKTIVLDAFMPNGRMEDVIRLAMKGPPMMAGEVFLKTKIMIPPLSGTVKARLQLNGDFRVAEGKFLKSTIQDKIDELSRKAQGQPANQAIDEVFSRLQGRFKMEDEQITLTDLSFLIPGAAVALDGTYQTDQDVLDFHGTLRLDAKISQTMTGWKRFVLKPVDPFFAKNGAGTFLHIKIGGSSKAPKFGLEKGGKKDNTPAKEEIGSLRGPAK